MMFGEMKGTYTADGINTLCEALKSSSITTLKCAPAPKPKMCLLCCPVLLKSFIMVKRYKAVNLKPWVKCSIGIHHAQAKRT